MLHFTVSKTTVPLLWVLVVALLALVERGAGEPNTCDFIVRKYFVEWKVFCWMETCRGFHGGENDFSNAFLLPPSCGRRLWGIALQRRSVSKIRHVGADHFGVFVSSSRTSSNQAVAAAASGKRSATSGSNGTEEKATARQWLRC